MTEHTKEATRNRAVLVGLNAHSLSREDNASETSLEELAALVETAGGTCVGSLLQNRDAPEARTFIGEGKVAEVTQLVQAQEADLVVFDNELSPSQQRVLTEEMGVQVIDRAGLILDIFAQRARTKEGRLQVELAQYKYLLPRLTGMWGHLVRQTASGGKSPIGTRGPGETQLETDRRHIRRKIAKLTEDLQEVRRIRAVQRDRREKNEVPVVAIVGYTNAGKSTLLNALTDAGIPARNRLFDTLDTTTRTLEISDTCTVLISDTVGFIRKLPHHLVEAFKATLEELSYADLILHVIDASNPEWREQAEVVEGLITQLGAQTTPRIEVFNKSDIYVGEIRPHGEDIVSISAKTGEGLDKLLEKIRKRLDTGVHRVPWPCPMTRAAFWTPFTGRPRWSPWSTGRPFKWWRSAQRKPSAKSGPMWWTAGSPPRPSGRTEPWQNTTSLRRTAKRSSQRSAPASSATSGGWRARRRPGRKSPRPRPSTTMPGTTAGVTSSGRGASPATPTMESPRARPASPCWRSFAGKGWRMSAAWSPGTWRGAAGNRRPARAYTRSAKDALEAAGSPWSASGANRCGVPLQLPGAGQGEIAAAQGILGGMHTAPRCASPPCCRWSTGRPMPPASQSSPGKGGCRASGGTFQAAPMPPPR